MLKNDDSQIFITLIGLFEIIPSFIKSINNSEYGHQSNRHEGYNKNDKDYDTKEEK